MKRAGTCLGLWERKGSLKDICPVGRSQLVEKKWAPAHSLLGKQRNVSFILQRGKPRAGRDDGRHEVEEGKSLCYQPAQ